MKKLFKLIFDFRLSEIKTFFKRLFGKYNKGFVRKRIKMSLRKDTFKCEKRLESRKKVEEFSRFYHKNKELLYYVTWDLSYNYKNSADAFLKFFEDCAGEEEKYRLQEQLENRDKKKK